MEKKGVNEARERERADEEVTHALEEMLLATH